MYEISVVNVLNVSNRASHTHSPHNTDNKPQNDMKKKTLALLLTASLPFASIGWTNSHSHAKSSKDVVDVLVAPPTFETLVAAVTAAGLVDTLKGSGPFTIFAPTDAAFKALPEGTVQELLKPENRDQLVSILTYHVVPGKVMAADVKPGEVETVNGSKINITVRYGKVKINDAEVIATDLSGSNGVIHIIDKVIIPSTGG